MTEPTKLMSAEEFAHMENPSYDKAVATYAAALTALREAEQARDAATKRVAELEEWKNALSEANFRLQSRVAELEAEKERQAGLSSGGASHSAYQHAIDRADALAVELAELRGAVDDWTWRCEHTEERDGWLRMERAEERLRNLAAQPQGERGKALLDVVEAARVRGHCYSMAAFGAYCADVGEWRCPGCVLTQKLAAIDGAQL